MFIGIRTVKKALSIKKSLYIFGLPVFKILTKYVGNNKVKTKIYFIMLPIIFILSSNLEKKIKLLGITLYHRKNEKPAQPGIESMINNIKKELTENIKKEFEDKYMEMELLIKTVASSIREIRRLENKDIN